MAKVMFCDQCGAPLPDAGAFCERCGAPRPSEDRAEPEAMPPGDTGKMGTVPLAYGAPTQVTSTQNPYASPAGQHSSKGIVKWVFLGMLMALLLVGAGFAMGLFGKPGAGEVHVVATKASPSDGGTATASAQEVAEGTGVTLTATPSDGYEFVNWTLEGANAKIDDANSAKAMLTVGTADVTVTANFRKGAETDDADDEKAAEDEKKEKKEEPKSEAKTDAYTLPDSDRRRYSKSELSGLSDWELRVARNEIYARHGYRFESADLQAHFEGCSWYEPTTPTGEFDEGLLNDIERYNVGLILSLESNEDEYVLPESSVRRYSYSEVAGLSDWDLKVARNEIYARHGYRFESSDLQSHFDGCSWYEARTPAGQFDDGLLNDIEKQNIELISSIENRDQKATPKYATGYVLSDSDTHRYTRSELSSLSSWELRIARNEIYARHGYIFESDDLREHFENCGWYSPNPRFSPGEFDDSLLNDIERANVDLISSME